jgi:hypothetical protein
MCFLRLTILRLPGAALLLRVAWIARRLFVDRKFKLSHLTFLPVLMKNLLSVRTVSGKKAQNSKPWEFYFVAPDLAGTGIAWGYLCFALVT